MPNATPAATRRGWELFRRSQFLAPMEEVNAWLASEDLPPVSLRTYGHYQKLSREGYDHYVSINRFDVARAGRPYENLSATNRYRLTSSSSPASVTLVTDDGPFAATGRVERIGEAGAVLVFKGKTMVAGLARAKLRPADYLHVSFADGKLGPIAARVIEVEHDEHTMLIEVEFTRLRSITEFTGRRALSSDAVAVTLTASDDNDRAADLVGRRIYYFLELIESSRALLNEVLSSEAADRSLVIEPPVITSLRMESPLVIQLGTPHIVLSVAMLGWQAARGGVKLYAKIQEGRVHSATARKTRAEAASIELDNEGKQDDQDTRRIVLGEIRSQLQTAGVQLARRSTHGGPDRLSPLARQLETAAASLIRQEVASIDTQTDDSKAVPTPTSRPKGRRR